MPIIALSQLSRQVENRDDKRPQLSDLRESGSIEQDADVVMFVYPRGILPRRTRSRARHAGIREVADSTWSLVHGKAEVIIGKQRHGPTGTVELQFEASLTRFGDLAPRQSAAGAQLIDVACARLNRSRLAPRKMRHEHRLRSEIAPASSLLSPEANQRRGACRPRPASSPSISTPSSPTGASSRRRRCRPNAPPWSRPMPMAAAPSRWRARWPTPAARRSSSPRWMRRRCVRGAVPASAAIYVLDGFFQNSGDAYAEDQLQAGDRRPQRARRMGRVLPPLGLERRRRHPYRHRHEPARA